MLVKEPPRPFDACSRDTFPSSYELNLVLAGAPPSGRRITEWVYQANIVVYAAFGAASEGKLMQFPKHRRRRLPRRDTARTCCFIGVI